MRHFAEVTLTAVLGALVAFAAACGGDDGGTTGPSDGPTTGTIAVAATTTGDDMDINGYSVMLDGTERAAIGSNGSVNLTSVDPGSRSVSLSGVAENCAVGGEHPRSVSVSAGATAQAAFEVACVATVGSIEVTTTTTGEGVDPDGYVVTVDGGSGQSIGANQTLTIPDIPVGNRQVELSDIASNCSVAGENPTSATVPLGGSVDVSFDISCTAPPPGTIAFISSRDGPQDEVYIMNGAGGGVTRLTDMAEPKHPPTARLSPDGTKVLFAAGEPADLWVANVDGTGLQRLTNATEWSIDHVNAVWSPDGTQVAYSDDGVIWMINDDGTARTLFTDLYSSQNPAWSPDGTRIAFTAQDTSVCCDHYIWSSNVDGSDLQQLSGGTDVIDRQARWSPDGARIAFVRGVTDWGIWVMNADGTGSQLVVADVGRPAWSPDGSLIAFAGQGLETVRPDGSDRRQLVDMNIDTDSGYPYWSPDGSTIAFMSWPSGTAGAGYRDIFTIKPDGSGLTNITNHPAEDAIGSWGP